MLNLDNLTRLRLTNDVKSQDFLDEIGPSKEDSFEELLKGLGETEAILSQILL